MDIDIVYTYVNSKDEEWVQTRNENLNMDEINDCRFRDNDELLFSLRSIEKYAPWIRKIYIITNSSMPEWLDTSNEKIVIVRHEEIMPESILPCYNSNVLEKFFWEIEGLSEIFLFANDDMYFCNHVTKDFFVKDGKPIVRMRKREIVPQTDFFRIMYNSQQLFKERYNIQYDLIPTHNIDVYSKSGMQKCKEEFINEFQKIYNNKFRTDEDTQRVIFQYYMIYHGLCDLVQYDITSPAGKFVNAMKKILLPSKYLDFIIYDIHTFFSSKIAKYYFSHRPKLVCINDSENTSDEELKQYHELMLKTFPEKSSFEK
ncbi:MAG: hypothetical protein J5517_00625 [Eubacterium sp.]|nr:hypothetical protein [Eubacterium sp.]